jgi:hypothetical protein
MRTSTTITEVEKNAYDLFCQQHHILNDQSPDGLRNGEHIGGYIGHTWNENIDEHTLGVALEKLRDRLTFIPPLQAEVVEILGKLDQGQRDIVAIWLGKQQRLETEGEQGFSNVSVLLAWLLNRRYAITEQGLTMALGNCQTNGRRKLYWKEGPKRDRAYGPGGKLNHAFGLNDEPAKSVEVQQEFHPNGRRNHAYKPTQDAAAKPAPAPDAWQEICQLHLKQWITPGQRDKLRAEYDAGIATGKSWREIGTALGLIVKGWERGR